MLILPISHEDMTARRWPVATTAIIGLCVLAWAGSLPAESAAEKRIADAKQSVGEFVSTHPYLRPDTAGSAAMLMAKRLGLPAPPVPDAVTIAEESEELVRLEEQVSVATKEHPFHRFGWVPGDKRFVSIFTYQFLHGGILHLLGNLWFLWLCGCNLEDRWGRAVFPGFYLGAGIAAALCHAAFTGNASMPIIGASGAVAGAMGAFLVIFAATRIRFFYVYWLAITPRYGTFAAPAWVMLALWLATELFWAVLGVGTGVAHWAHVGGFVFGAAVAGGLKLSGLDAKLDSDVESAVSRVQDPRLLAAAELVTARRFDAAFVALDALVREQPGSVDFQLEMLRAADFAGDRVRGERAYGRLVSLYERDGAKETAINLLREATAVRLDGAIPPPVRMRLLGEEAKRASSRPPPGFPERSVPPGPLSGGREVPFLLDLVVKSAPHTTPEGEPFIDALAKAFGIDVAVAERVACEAPVVVKRAVERGVAEGMRDVLRALGAEADVVPTNPRELLAPRISEQPARPVSSWLPPAGASRPTANPPMTASLPPIAQRRSFHIPRPVFLAGAVAAVGFAVFTTTRWIKGQSDQRLLGNTPMRETLCVSTDCLDSVGIRPPRRAEYTLLLAWQGGCLEPTYAASLTQLSKRYPESKLAIVGAALAVPASSDPRAFGRRPMPAPTEWPEQGCSPEITLVPPAEGHVNDFLAPPITYLFDSDGRLLAVWRGGMSPSQREQLATWLGDRL